ncbi:hypothetical protein F5146DRAFT_938971, partial [Armillaria mellea]
NVLYNVCTALVEVHRFSSKAMDGASDTEGDIVWLHFFINALSLQTCNPHVIINARDTWTQANPNRTYRANAHTLWNVFMSHRLGVNNENYVDNMSIPCGC